MTGKENMFRVREQVKPQGLNKIDKSVKVTNDLP